MILGGGFDPSVIFAEMQGAWLEPRIGGMWQENTGTTPTTAAGESIGKINDLSGYGYNATQATVANRPTLQYVNGLPLVRCNSNQFMTVSLPAINVRRNLLTYSEDFTNAAWTKSLLSVTQLGGSISRITPSGNGSHNLRGSGAVAATQTLQVIAKYNGYQLWLQLHNTNGSTAFFDLQNGTVSNNSSFPATFGSGATQVAKSITPLADGWYLCTLSATLPSSGNVIIGVARDSLTYSYTADGTSGVYIMGAQLELGSVATDYQKVTDWTSEQFSSSGSVYFALPTGMSALHNQSIGTSYSAPIQSMDLYGTVIVPARLSNQREAQLQNYFEKLAGLR